MDHGRDRAGAARRLRDQIRWRFLSGVIKRGTSDQGVAEAHHGRYWVVRAYNGLYQASGYEAWNPNALVWYDAHVLLQDGDLGVLLRFCEWHHRATNARFPLDALTQERPAHSAWVELNQLT
jgi:hypothetical protein